MDSVEFLDYKERLEKAKASSALIATYLDKLDELYDLYWKLCPSIPKSNSKYEQKIKDLEYKYGTTKNFFKIQLDTLQQFFDLIVGFPQENFWTINEGLGISVINTKAFKGEHE